MPNLVALHQSLTIVASGLVNVFFLLTVSVLLVSATGPHLPLPAPLTTPESGLDSHPFLALMRTIPKVQPSVLSLCHSTFLHLLEGKKRKEKKKKEVLWKVTSQGDLITNS